MQIFSLIHRYATALLIVACALGCDTSLKPGDQLYVLKHPTREWKIPERKPAADSSPTEQKETDTQKSPVLDLAETVFSVPKNEAVEKPRVPHIYIDPPVMLAKRVRPDHTYETSIVISSKRWKNFELTDISSPLEGLTWKVEPANQATLDQFDLLSGWTLTASLPSSLPVGEEISSVMQVEAKALDGSEESQQFEIPINGKVLRRLAVYGESIDASGTIGFGVQPTRIAHKRVLNLKVHDKQPELKLLDVIVQPEFLQVKLLPYGESGEVSNFYKLEVEIPASAPEYAARLEQLGEIRLKFDHPRIDELVLKVDFVLQGHATNRSLADVD